MAELALRPIEHQALSFMIRNGMSSRKEIAKGLGVTSATISNVVAALIDRGILYEVGEMGEGKVGRKHIMLEVNRHVFFVAGFDVTGTSIRATVLNIKAEILEKKIMHFETLCQSDLDEAMDWLEGVVFAYGADKFLGLGLLVQGFVEGSASKSLPIKDVYAQLARRMSMPIYPMNNVTGLAVTELYLGGAGDNFLLVKFGYGVGGVIAVDGEILTGAHNRAGEIGHIQWNAQSSRTCRVCGRKGCLESEINYGQIIRKADPKCSFTVADAATVLQASERDGGEALRYAIESLAKAVAICADIIDPAQIYLAGELFVKDWIFERFRESVCQNRNMEQDTEMLRIECYPEKRVKAAGITALDKIWPKPKA